MSDLKDQIRKAEASVAARPPEMDYLSPQGAEDLHWALGAECLDQPCSCDDEPAWEDCCTTCLIQRAREGLEQREARIESLEKENAALREAQRWIPVSERLPEDGIEVLVYESEDSSIYSACKWYDEWNGFPGERITHWMPLPAPPTTDKGYDPGMLDRFEREAE